MFLLIGRPRMIFLEFVDYGERRSSVVLLALRKYSVGKLVLTQIDHVKLAEHLNFSVGNE